MEKKPSQDDTIVISKDDITNDKLLNSNDELVSEKEIPQTKSGISDQLQSPTDGDSYDDLDDLDDMLDEFDPVIPENPTVSNFEAHTESFTDDDFEKQIKAGMAEIFGSTDNPSALTANFENILKELGEAATQGQSCKKQPSSSMPNDSNAKNKPSPAKIEEEVSFHDTIKKTMERMEVSGEQATAAAAALENNGDILSEMLKAMQGLDIDGEGGGEEDFSKALLGMMEQLTNKEILYEPMKELNENFPGWLEKNAKEVSKADLERYKKQQIYVNEIVKRFESEKYDDNSVDDKEYIVERMQKMQTAGSPPSDLVGDMAAAQEIFGAPEEGCPMQ